MVLTVVFDGTQILDDDGTWADHQGGGASGQDTDNKLSGVNCRGRKVSGGTLGFSLDNGSGIDLDQAEDHVGMYIYVNTPAVWDTVANAGASIRLGSHATDESLDYDQWEIWGNDNRPPNGGWFPFWFEVNTSDTPDATNGSYSTTSTRWFGMEFTCASISGNFRNCFIDTIQHILGTTNGGLTGTGTGGTFDDFYNFDSGSSANFFGVIEKKDNTFLLYARLTIGTATSAVLNDSNQIILFGDQPYVTTSFMGLTFDLQNASTNIDLTSCTIASTTTVQGDIIVTGTTGDLDWDGMTLSNLRVVTLTSACSVINSTIDLCGLITGEATLTATTISNASGAVALLWDANLDPNGELDNTTWISDGTGHAMELGTNTPTSITLTGHSYSGYGAATTTDATIYNNSAKAITINVSNGDTPTIRNGTSASTIVNNTQTITINDLVVGERIAVYRSEGTDSTLVDKSMFTSASSGNDSGDSTFDITITIPTDTPASGTLKLYERDAAGDISLEVVHTYSAYSGTQFTGVSPTLTRTYDSNDTALAPYILKEVTTDPETTSLNYTVDRDLVVVWRLKGFDEFLIAGVFGSTGFTTGIVKTVDGAVDLP